MFNWHYAIPPAIVRIETHHRYLGGGVLVQDGTGDGTLTLSHERIVVVHLEGEDPEALREQDHDGDGELHVAVGSTPCRRRHALRRSDLKQFDLQQSDLFGQLGRKIASEPLRHVYVFNVERRRLDEVLRGQDLGSYVVD